MPCGAPLKAFQIGVTDKGKKDLKICSFETDHLEWDGNRWRAFDAGHDNKLAGKLRIVVDPDDAIFDYSVIPCGQCWFCRLQRSRQWADRMTLELMEPEPDVLPCASFITLTYSEDCVPTTEYALCDDEGEIIEEGLSLTLRKTDFQLFMKRLRKALGDNRIRFFACGEYGSKTCRPHYHAIVYGWNFPDRVFYKEETRGGIHRVYYNSPFLESVWGKGHAVVADVNWNTCAYVARYVTKKHVGKEKGFYDLFNLEPEFSLMSRRPGIGHRYFEMHKDELIEFQEIHLPNAKGSHKSGLPKYYDALIEREFEDIFEDIKDSRAENAQNNYYQTMMRTNKHWLDYVDGVNKELEKRTRILREGIL